MKTKKILCTLSLCTCIVASFTSCNTEAVETSEKELSETMKEDAQLITFLNSIDSVNNVSVKRKGIVSTPFMMPASIVHCFGKKNTSNKFLWSG